MLIIYLQICEVNHEHYKRNANPNIFFWKPSRGMSSSCVIFFSSTLLIYIYIYILWFFMYFLKSNFRTWTIKLFLDVFYKIKKLAIIEIILLNVTHISLIYFYCLVIYIYIYFFFFNNSKQWTIWLTSYKSKSCSGVVF